MAWFKRDRNPEDSPEVAQLEDRRAEDERLRINDDPNDVVVRWLTAEVCVELGLSLDTVEVPEGLIRPFTDEETRLSELSRDEALPQEWRDEARAKLDELRGPYIPIEDRPALPPRVTTSGDPVQDWYEAHHPEEAAQELADRVIPIIGSESGDNNG